MQRLPKRKCPCGAAPLTRADVEAWLDGYLPYALQTGDIAGAVVVVVKDGEVLLQKGYGYSDVAARKPVDPELTLFRPGSISKLFTWTAVMQQVEQGKLDLDKDINEYLDFKIPPRDGQPITLRNIMTHTAGFEEQVKGLMGAEGAANSGARRATQGLGADANLRSGRHACVFELCDGAGWLHRRASVRRRLRRIPRTAHLHAAGHEARNLPSTAAGRIASRSCPRAMRVASGDPKPFEIVGVAPAGACPHPARTWRNS